MGFMPVLAARLVDSIRKKKERRKNRL